MVFFFNIMTDAYSLPKKHWKNQPSVSPNTTGPSINSVSHHQRALPQCNQKFLLSEPDSRLLHHQANSRWEKAVFHGNSLSDILLHVHNITLQWSEPTAWYKYKRTHPQYGSQVRRVYSYGIKVRKGGILWKTTQRCTSALTFITLQWSNQATYESRPTHPPCWSQVRRGVLLPEHIQWYTSILIYRYH